MYLPTCKSLLWFSQSSWRNLSIGCIHWTSGDSFFSLSFLSLAVSSRGMFCAVDASVSSLSLCWRTWANARLVVRAASSNCSLNSLDTIAPLDLPERGEMAPNVKIQTDSSKMIPWLSTASDKHIYIYIYIYIHIHVYIFNYTALTPVGTTKTHRNILFILSLEYNKQCEHHFKISFVSWCRNCKKKRPKNSLILRQGLESGLTILYFIITVITL